ncbi:hypothetical protein ACWC2K_13550 [Streptomyces chattanoogensis]|uniref:hypothetical protein n=1 Tax=Streptomyces chattanoogensis TaxID=66876 RepID=UPI003696D5F5
MRASQTNTVKITIVLVVATVAALTWLLVSLTRPTGPEPDRPNIPTRAVDLTRRISDYTSPFNEDSGYRHPTHEERQTVAQGVGLLLDGHRAQARQRLSRVDFEIRTVTDSATGRRYAEVGDRTERGPAPRGWGRVYVDLGAPAHWSVQVPHPVADARTEQLGVSVLRGPRGGVLVIAGAHRRAGDGDAADVAHRTDTVFDAVCDELTERGLPGIQVHGFADDSVPDYDVIASTGDGERARPEGQALADALRARTWHVCRAWARSCPLEGRTNVQGRKAAAEGVPFLHVEFSNTIRTSPALPRRAAEALGTVTATWSAQPVHRPRG